MASGSFSTSNAGVHLRIDWSSTPGNGGSTVNATLYAVNASNVYMQANVYGGYSVNVNGGSASGSGKALSGSYGGSVELVSKSQWVSYTGDKSITISGSADFTGINVYGVGALGKQSLSQTVNLDKIGSAPTMGSVTAPTTSTVSEKTTSITVKWNKASSYNNSVTYAIGCSINGGSYEWRYPDNNINTTSYTWDIGTPTQGATYKFAVYCANDIARSNYQYSGVVTINKLSPPTIGNISTFNPYVNNTLTVPLSGGSQTNGSGFTRRANIHVDGAYKYTGAAPSSNGNTSVGITVDAASIASDLGSKAYSNSSKFTVVAWCENSNGTRSSYVSKTFTVNINSDGGATPTLSLPTISGGAFNNAATCFIAGISTLNVSSPAASLRRAPSGTTISYKIACTGTITKNGQNAAFSGLTAGTKTITVTATDSRGLSVSVSKQVVVQSYIAPTIRAFTATRLDDPNTSAKLAYTLAYSPIYQYTDVDTKGNQLNGISLQQYKKNNFDWNTASNGLVLTKLETDSTYTIQLRIVDKVKTTTYITATQVISTIKTTMAWRSWGVGIGCIPQSGYNLDVTGKARFQGSVIYGVGGRDRTPITMLTGDANGDGIKIEAGGTVVVGSGESPSAFISGSGVGGDSETTYITSDYTIRFETNLDEGYANKQEFTMHTNGQMTIPSHINLGGSLKRDGVSSSWINGRNSAAVKMNSISEYSPAISVKTTNGSWEIGAYDNSSYTDQLIFGYVSDSDYNAGNNRQTKQYILKASGTPSGETVLTLNSAFPVGAVYITYNNNNPGNFLGGTWVRMAEGRGLFGIGKSTGRNGFSASVGEHEEFGDWTHQITAAELPPHNHSIGRSNTGAGRDDWGLVASGAHGGNVALVNNSNATTGATGGGESFYIMPPYIGIYVWRRTA